MLYLPPCSPAITTPQTHKSKISYSTFLSNIPTVSPKKPVAKRPWSFLLIFPLWLISATANAQPYKPIPISGGSEVKDVLSDKDIPTGQRGFARDYGITLEADDRLEVSVISPAFDTVVTLMDKDGNSIAENDDAGPDTTNSLLFARIPKAGNYVVRVQSFGGSRGGKFTLKVVKLRPTN